MKRATTFILILAIATLLMGCGSTKRFYGEQGRTSQLVVHTRVDTIYLTSQQYDSIYIYQDRLTDRSRDTLYIKDKSIEYRYKLLRDTIYKTRIDSIPYEVTIVKTKEITRPLTFYDKLCRSCFWFLIGVLGMWLVSKLKPYIKA